MMGSLLCVLKALIENQGNGAERTRGRVARGREELDRMRSCWPTKGSWVWSAGEIHWSFQKGKWYNPACGFRRFSWLLSKEWVAESKHWIGRATVAVRDGRSSDRGWGRKDQGEKRVEQSYLNRKSDELEVRRREEEKAAVDGSLASNHLLRWVAWSRSRQGQVGVARSQRSLWASSFEMQESRC